MYLSNLPTAVDSNALRLKQFKDIEEELDLQLPALPILEHRYSSCLIEAPDLVKFEGKNKMQ